MHYTPLNRDAFVGGRIAEARKAAGMTQAELAEKLGFADRQILSNLEKGLRKASPEEIVKAAELTGVDVLQLTDPYRLTSEKRCFAWRVKKDSIGDNVPYEEKGWNLIAAYMRFSDALNRLSDPILPQMVVYQDATYQYVRQFAELLVKAWELGETPAKKLVEVVREKLNVELLFVEAPDEVSGASFRNDRFCAMLINRRHSEGRRNFSIAHELFHILSWTTLHPDHCAPTEVEEVTTKSEKLANVFAAALLMPAETVTEKWRCRPKSQPLASWLEETAAEMSVSADALFWSLVTLRRLKKDEKPADFHLQWESGGSEPPLFSPKFAELLHSVLDAGEVSVRKALSLLDLTYESLDRLMNAHGFTSPHAL